MNFPRSTAVSVALLLSGGDIVHPPFRILPDSSKALPVPEVGLTVALHSAPRLSLCMPKVCCALETSQEHVRDRQVLPGDKTLERLMF